MFGMKKSKLNLILMSSLVFLVGCSMPDGTLHPEYSVTSEHIVGRWILSFDASEPPIHDLKTHKDINTPDYEVLDFKKDGTFSLELHKKSNTTIVKNKDMRWWLRVAENTNDKGPVIAIKNMRYYPSVVLGSDKSFRNNPDELMLAVGRWFSHDPNDLYFCFETVDINEVCFSRETPWKEK